MNRFRITTYIFLISVSLIGFVSCELFGLDLQKSYDFDYEIGMADNKVYMSTWEFMQSRTDLFSLLIEAVNYTDMQSYYEEGNTTHLLLTNSALNDGTNGYFTHHKLMGENEETGEPEEYTPSSLSNYSKEQVKELLLYHIVEGRWTWSNVPAEKTWFTTFAAADTAQVNIYLKKETNPNMRFNDFEGHYRGNISARTSNLLSDENSFIHVMDNWLDRPTRRQIFGFEN